MAALVQHFGDTADGLKPCGHCDFCAPEQATASPFRDPTAQEDRNLRALLGALKGGVSRSTGKLHTDLALTPDRKLFDTWLDALSRAGLLTLHADTFTNPEGTVITYKKAILTHEGALITPTAPLGVLLRDSTPAGSIPSRKTPAGKPTKASLKAGREQTTAAYTPAQRSLEASLREWRKTEAAKTGKPAFIVFGDTVLHNLVLAAPQTLPELLTVSGIGPEKADRYGADLVALCRESASQTPFSSTQIRHTTSVNSSENKDVPASSAFTKVRATTNQSAKDALHISLVQSPGSTPPQPLRAKSPLYTPPVPPELTATQQALDTRLCAWRAAESERLNVPQFFVLSTSTLRGIAVASPQNLAQLKILPGLGQEKLEKFGPAILALCTQE